MIAETKFIWFNGKLVAWKEATIHVLNHSLHYGSGVFEGIRCYDTPKGPAIFRLTDHMKRLIRSCESYEIPCPYSAQEFCDAAIQLIKENQINSCYIRPLVYYGYGHMGLNPKGAIVDSIIACWPWGTYLGEEGLENGINAKISKWNRIHASTLPMQAKCCGNYANSILGKLDAVNNGFDEAIMLNVEGRVAEGPGENIFLVKNNELITPSVEEGVLKGITRDSIMTVAKDFGIIVVERPVEKKELFSADELFFTGTAAEVTPIRSVDKKTIGEGKRGPVTKRIQEKFFEIAKGTEPKYGKWLSYVK